MFGFWALSPKHSVCCCGTACSLGTRCPSHTHSMACQAKCKNHMHVRPLSILKGKSFRAVLHPSILTSYSYSLVLILDPPFFL